MRGHAVVRRLAISSRSCRITEQKHGGELNADPRGTFTLDSADSCYLCGPLCCMFGLNWLGGGGTPTEETGGFIIPAGTQQVNRTWNRGHFSYSTVTRFSTCGGSRERLRRTSVVPVQGLRGAGSKPTLVAPHPGLCLGVRGCSDVTLLAHVDGDDCCRLLMPGGVSPSCRGRS